MPEWFRYLALVITFILILFLVGGAYYLGTLQCVKMRSLSLPSPAGQDLPVPMVSSSLPSQLPTQAQSPLPVPLPSPTPSVALNCNDVQGTLASVFITPNYDALLPCFAASVRYSRFESSQAENLNPAQAVERIKSLSGSVNSWVVDQSHQNIQKLKESHPQAWFDAFIVLADNGRALAFNFDRNQQIQSVVYVTNWPAITR